MPGTNSEMNKHGPIYLGSHELDDKHASHIDGIDYDPEETNFVSSEPRYHRCRRRNPWRKLARTVMTIGWIGMSIYIGLKHFYVDEQKMPSSLPLQPQAAPAICQTPQCIHAASEILYNLAPNRAKIDPCTNFDEYVCGGLRKLAFDTSWNALNPPDAADKGNFKKLKDAYNACLDTATLEQRGAEPLLHTLGELQKAITFLMRTGTDALISPGITPDDRDPDNVVISVTPPREIGLSAREYYNNTETVAKYTAVLKDIFTRFKVDNSDQVAEDVVAFEKKLADVTPDTATQEDVTKSYNPLSIKATENLVPQIALSKIVRELAPKDYKKDIVIVGSPSYLKALAGILDDTQRNTVSLFLQWKLIQKHADAIEDDRVTPLTRFNNVLAGKDPAAKAERWRTCIKSLDESLGWSLSRFYVLDSFPEESKKLGDQVVSDIKERFVFTLDQTEWMSPDVRKLGIKKVENIVQKVGFPTKSPNVLDPKDVEKYYQGLEVSNSTYYENLLAVAQFSLEFDWAKLGKPTDRNEWDMTAPTVNAYYNPPGNEIVFPAGIMQPPVFYGPNAPLYLAYGAFGAVSGHELSHAFDSTGRHYDQNGNYTDWWDSKTVDSFEERAQCFVDQYSNFTVDGPGGKVLHVNGRLTLGENIADAGGLTASYHAWKKRDEASPDKHLPGLSEFTKEQLFFIAYGSWWCGKDTKEAAEKSIYNDPHAPKSARIINTAANSREFKEAFQCPDKTPVCKLW
ncbi:Peptidase M13 neprilysin [Penicillium chermesinum]|nr:Peptidase M13 neprilysin [Penicillium chermesinum]